MSKDSSRLLRKALSHEAVLVGLAERAADEWILSEELIETWELPDMNP